MVLEELTQAVVMVTADASSGGVQAGQVDREGPPTELARTTEEA